MIYNMCVLFSLFLWWTNFTDPSFDELIFTNPFPLNLTALLIHNWKQKLYEEIVVNPFNRVGNDDDAFILHIYEKRL